jgi:putative restriction endonuclease
MYERDGERWTRDELLIALNIYQKVPFGKFDQQNRLLTDLSIRMQRKPAALPMKLSNLASLDVRHQTRGVHGLSGASHLDAEIWTEFHANQEELVPLSEELLVRLVSGDGDKETPVDVVDQQPIRKLAPPSGPSERMIPVKVRRGQEYFRQVVLNQYGSRCAVTGLAIRELLVASHIIPWSQRKDSRYDGIALNALHDKAFDRGLITFDTQLRLVCAPSLRDNYTSASVAANFKAYEGKPMAVPSEAAGPKAEYLEYHRDRIFGRLA